MSGDRLAELAKTHDDHKRARIESEIAEIEAIRAEAVREHADKLAEVKRHTADLAEMKTLAKTVRKDADFPKAEPDRRPDLALRALRFETKATSFYAGAASPDSFRAAIEKLARHTAAWLNYREWMLWELASHADKLVETIGAALALAESERDKLAAKIGTAKTAKAGRTAELSALSGGGDSLKSNDPPKLKK
ncbi:MAG: hypothetical protein OXQ93_14415 [Gemmatimonadota bacterium]|nr:hypothetical protein [Gemmatimonadota bacterium]